MISFPEVASMMARINDQLSVVDTNQFKAPNIRRINDYSYAKTCLGSIVIAICNVDQNINEESISDAIGSMMAIINREGGSINIIDSINVAKEGFCGDAEECDEYIKYYSNITFPEFVGVLIESANIDGTDSIFNLIHWMNYALSMLIVFAVMHGINVEKVVSMYHKKV